MKTFHVWKKTFFLEVCWKNTWMIGYFTVNPPTWSYQSIDGSHSTYDEVPLTHTQKNNNIIDSNKKSWMFQGGVGRFPKISWTHQGVTSPLWGAFSHLTIGQNSANTVKSPYLHISILLLWVVTTTYWCMEQCKYGVWNLFFFAYCSTYCHHIAHKTIIHSWKK